jgi:CDGSH-type Zn-finger protein
MISFIRTVKFTKYSISRSFKDLSRCPAEGGRTSSFFQLATPDLQSYRNSSGTSKKNPGDGVPKELFDFPGKEHTTEWRATEKGKIYDKKPFKFRCEKGKVYFWCNCGHSHTQPFCDGTHKTEKLRIRLRPVKFVPTEDKDYWFCNCKQTEHRPLCDGTHKKQEIQDAIKS